MNRVHSLVNRQEPDHRGRWRVAGQREVPPLSVSLTCCPPDRLVQLLERVEAQDLATALFPGIFPLKFYLFLPTLPRLHAP